MTAHQIELETLDLIAADAHLAQLAESGVDAVHGPLTAGEFANYALRRFHPGYGLWRDLDALASARNRGDLGERELLATESEHLATEYRRLFAFQILNQ